MAFSWPVRSSTDNVTGVTTIRWGTQGACNSAIVISADQAQEVEKIYLEQGEGLKATRIMLKQGQTWDFTFQDDSTVFATPPKVGDVITVTDFMGSNNAATTGWFGTVVDNNYRTARKQEGQRVIRVENLILIDTQTVGGGGTPSF